MSGGGPEQLTSQLSLTLTLLKVAFIYLGRKVSSLCVHTAFNCDTQYYPNWLERLVWKPFNYISLRAFRTNNLPVS